jgi:hypothetical protein
MIFSSARCPAYGHAARYFVKLDALATHAAADVGVNSHAAFRAALMRMHGRKSSFWSLV